MAQSSKLVKNTFIYALGDIFPKLFSLITFPILTTYLLPSEYGIVNYVNTIDTFITAIGLLSLNTYYLVYYFRVGDEDEQKKLLGNLSLFIIGINVGLSLLLYIVGPLLFHTWGSEVEFYPYIAIGVATTFCNIVTVLPSALYRVQERPLPLTILNVIKGLLIMGLTLIAVIYYKADALSVLWSRFIISALFAVVFLYITCKNSIFRFNRVQLLEGLKFSLPLVPGTIAFYLYSIFDRVLIEKYLTLTELGIYSTASTLALLLNIISNGAYKAFEPFFFKTFGSDNFVSVFQKVRDMLLFVVLIGGICLSVFSREFFIYFSSEKYDTAYLYVPIIVIGAIASAIGQMYTTVLTAQGRTKTNALITVAGAIISITLNTIFLRFVGIWAAAFVFAFTLFFTYIVSVFFAKINVQSGKAWVSTLLSVLFMCVFTYLYIEDNILISVAVKLIAVIFIVIILSLLLKVNPKSLLTSIFKR